MKPHTSGPCGISISTMDRRRCLLPAASGNAPSKGFAGSDPLNGFRGLAKTSGFAGRVALAREARNLNRKPDSTPLSLPDPAKPADPAKPPGRQNSYPISTQ